MLSCNMARDTKSIQFKNVESVEVSSFISEYELIELETTEDILIGYIKQSIIYKERIYILDAPIGNAIYMFDLNGKFLNKIKNVGQGPGEYIMPYNIEINEFDNELYLKDVAQNKLLIYDALTLQFKREESLTWEALYFSFIPNSNKIVLYNNLEITNKGKIYASHIAILDTMNNQLEDKIPIEVKTGYILNPFSTLTANNNELYFSHPYKGSVYKISNDEFTEEYEIVFKNKEFAPTAFLKANVSSDQFVKIMQESEYINFFTFFNMKNNFYSSFYASGEYYLSFYNKERREGVYFTTKKIVDDMGIGCFEVPIYADNEYCYSIINLNSIDKDKVIKNKKMNEILKKSTKDTNPLILRCKISY